MLSTVRVELPHDVKKLQRRGKKKAKKELHHKKKSKKHKKDSSSDDEASAGDPCSTALRADASQTKTLDELLINPFASTAPPANETSKLAEPGAIASDLYEFGRDALKSLLSGKEQNPSTALENLQQQQQQQQPRPSGAAERELNPFYKDGGSGLPSEAKADDELNALSSSISAGAKLWRQRQLFRLEQQAAKEGCNLQEILLRHFGRLSDSALAALRHDTRTAPVRHSHQHLGSSEAYRISNTNRDFNEQARKLGWRRQTDPRRSSPPRKDRQSMSVSSRFADRLQSISTGKLHSLNQNDHPGDAKKFQNTGTSDPIREDGTGADLNMLSAMALKARIRGETAEAKRLEGVAALKQLKGEELQRDDMGETLNNSTTCSVWRPFRPQHKQLGRQHAGSNEATAEQCSKGKEEDDKQTKEQSLMEILREEGHLSSSANERAMANQLIGGSNASERRISAVKHRILEERREARKNRLNQSESSCASCIDSRGFERLRGGALVSLSARAYLCVPPMRYCVLEGHLLIIPIAHCAAVTGIDEDSFEEVRNYCKSLVAFYGRKGLSPIFIETVTRQSQHERELLGLGHHTEIEVLAIHHERLREARSFFRKALDEAENIWANHKTVIEVQGRSGIRSAIPPNFPYIYVDFSLEDGLAHVIEDGENFKRNFGREVIMGMLGVEQTARVFTEPAAYTAHVKRLQRDFSLFDWAPSASSTSEPLGA